jgi:hypothetical protein
MKSIFAKKNSMEISATKKADDIELINKAKSGDQQAFAALMAKYRNAVFFYDFKK